MRRKVSFLVQDNAAQYYCLKGIIFSLDFCKGITLYVGVLPSRWFSGGRFLLYDQIKQIFFQQLPKLQEECYVWIITGWGKGQSNLIIICSCLSILRYFAIITKDRSHFNSRTVGHASRHLHIILWVIFKRSYIDILILTLTFILITVAFRINFLLLKIIEGLNNS